MIAYINNMFLNNRRFYAAFKKLHRFSVMCK